MRLVVFPIVYDYSVNLFLSERGRTTQRVLLFLYCLYFISTLLLHFCVKITTKVLFLAACSFVGCVCLSYTHIQEGKTALDYAKQKKHSEVVALLK